MTSEFGGALLGRLADLQSNLLSRLPLHDYLVALIFVLFGLFLAKVISVLVLSLLDILRFDRLAEKVDLYEIIDGAHNDSPSRLLGRVLYWLTLSFFLAAAIDALQIVDIPLQLEALAGLASRVISFAVLLLLSDLFARFAGAVFDAVLKIVDHPFAGRGAKFIHYAITLAAGIVLCPVLGIDPETRVGSAVLVFGGLIGTATACASIVLLLKRADTRRRLHERYRIGDRITLQDSRPGVVRHLGDDHILIASDEDEWLMPAAWVLDSPVRKEEL